MAMNAPTRSRPAFVVDIPVGNARARQVLRAVDATLAAGGQGVQVTVRIPGAHPERDAIALACEADPRLSLVSDGDTARPPGRGLRVTLPPAARAGEGTLEAIAALLREEPASALELTIPGALGPLERFRWAAKLPRRALVRVIPSTGGVEPDRRAHRIPGARVGLGATRGPRVAQPPPPQGPLAHERAEHLRHRARWMTYRARADRSLQRLSRERTRARYERARSMLLERRLAATGPHEWAGWRGRQLARMAVAAPSAAANVALTPVRRAGRLIKRARRERRQHTGD